MSVTMLSLILALFAAAQTPNSGAGPKIAAIKQSLAENQARLRGYKWLETTEVLLKGELKNRKQAEYRYGPDGRVIRTPVGAAAAPGKPRGLRGKIASGKIEELQDYAERLASLVGRYVPANPESMQTSFQSGKASLMSSGELVFKDYAKPGDQVTYSFDTASRKLRNFNVTTYLDGPEDVVTLNVGFATLPDGTNAISQSVIESKQKQLQLKRSDSGHAKIAQ